MEAQAQDPQPEGQKKREDITFKIWPPLQSTRDAVVRRLIETLSTDSVLTSRYGTIPEDEATAVAHLIEDESFAAASVLASSSGEGDGIEILQVYSREISKRMLDSIKSRAASASTANNSAPQTLEPVAASGSPATTSEDVPSAEIESS